jgi:branched-chain amino acid aminotransferase
MACSHPLPGITRDSVLKLAPTFGYEVEERPIDIHELMAAIKAGTVTEAFGSGTAAVITPVGKLCYKDETLALSDGKVGAITRQLYDTLTGIQTGHRAGSNSSTEQRQIVCTDDREVAMMVL